MTCGHAPDCAVCMANKCPANKLRNLTDEQYSLYYWTGYNPLDDDDDTLKDDDDFTIEE